MERLRCCSVARMCSEAAVCAETTPIPLAQAITKGDGRGVAESTLSFSDNQTCPDPTKFVTDVVRADRSLSAGAALRCSDSCAPAWGCVAVQTCSATGEIVSQETLFETAMEWGFDVNTSEWMMAVMESVRRNKARGASTRGGNRGAPLPAVSSAKVHVSRAGAHGCGGVLGGGDDARAGGLVGAARP